MNTQITQFLKFRITCYMGNYSQNLLWPCTHTNPNCTLCQNNYKDTWPHLLTLYNYKYLEALRIERQNAAAHQLTNLLELSVHTRHLTLINAINQHGNQDNTIPPWISCCIFNTTQRECLAILRLRIAYIQGTTDKQNGLLIPTLDLIIQIINSPSQHDGFLDQAIQMKEDKYNPLIEARRAQGWKVKPLIVIITRVRGAIHTRSRELLENLHIPIPLIKETMKTIH